MTGLLRGDSFSSLNLRHLFFALGQLLLVLGFELGDGLRAGAISGGGEC